MSIEPNELLTVTVDVSASTLPRSEFPREWSNSMMDDYSLKGGESAALAAKANQAALGAYQAQVYAAENEAAIEALGKRVDSIERNVNALSIAVTNLIGRVSVLEEFNKNPYATLYRTAPLAILVPDSTNTDATFDSNIPGRKAALTTSRITLDEGGVYSLASTLDFSAPSAFTIEVVVGTTIWFTFTGVSVQQVTPVIDVPASAADDVYVNIYQTTGGDLSVTQNNIYLSISRQGAE